MGTNSQEKHTERTYLVGVWSDSECRYMNEWMELPVKMDRFWDSFCPDGIDYQVHHTEEVFGFESRILVDNGTWTIAIIHFDFDGNIIKCLKETEPNPIAFTEVSYRWWRKWVYRRILRGW